MPPLNSPTSLTITNPLVVYRALVATKQIKPDPAQHRLALHLQKLYHRLKDYEPEIDFSHRIKQISRLANQDIDSSRNAHGQHHGGVTKQRKSVFGSFQEQKEKTEATALTRRLTEPESAMQVQSPQGLLLYGEVGTGKSLLVDVLADCLPNRKKRRWHFNTFMLETFAKLEHLRKHQMNTVVSSDGSPSEEYSLLRLAREMISTSPILFLDEFQLPDRAASKILSNLLTSFFHLGGVLIATSNRMPEELANASGIEFAPPPATPSTLGLWSGRWGILGKERYPEKSQDMFSGKGEFGVFLDVLKARCEVWNLEGDRDWRRQEADDEEDLRGDVDAVDLELSENGFHGLEPLVAGNWGLGYEQSISVEAKGEKKETEKGSKSKDSNPTHYFVRPSTKEGDAVALAAFNQKWKARELASIPEPLDPHLSSSSPSSSSEIPWQTMTLTVYARPLIVPRHYNGVAKWTFDELCATNLGPADYITLASTFHTFILTAVPVLTLLHKNEARRLITLLDALYESRCRLLVSADAGPDDLFFPDTRMESSTEAEDGGGEGVYSETIAEIYQDRTAPFRPNISSYENDSSSTSGTRSVLADEDADFGPVLGRHAAPTQNSGTGLPHGSSSSTPAPPSAIDFSKTETYTGQDERFAYKRARSRVWEMCGARWWGRSSRRVQQDKNGNEDADERNWWRPLGAEMRRWEGDRVTGHDAIVQDEHNPLDEAESTNSSSPFRTTNEPPPRFSPVHAWGMMIWGKKAGVWGRGVEGVGLRGKGRNGGDGDGEGGGGKDGEKGEGKGEAGR